MRYCQIQHNFGDSEHLCKFGKEYLMHSHAREAYICEVKNKHYHVAVNMGSRRQSTEVLAIVF